MTQQRRNPLVARDNETVALAANGAEASIVLNYDYSLVPEDFRADAMARATDIKRRERRAAMDIVEIGKSLKFVKEHLKHGQFLPWIEQEFGWQRSMAENFMNVADEFPKFGNLGNYGLSAIYALSAPGVSDEIRVQARRIADSGQKVTHKIAKQLVDQSKPPRPTPSAKPDLPKPPSSPPPPATDRPLPGWVAGEPDQPAKSGVAAQVIEMAKEMDADIQRILQPTSQPTEPIAVELRLPSMAIPDKDLFVSQVKRSVGVLSEEGYATVANFLRIVGRYALDAQSDTPAATDAPQADERSKEERIRGLASILETALMLIGEDYGQLTGYFSHVPTAERTLREMIARLQENLTK